MADYYTLLARAVAGLPQSTPETRRAIYERARNALLGQLRISDPPADEADIARESGRLDAAIARLEAEFSGKPANPAAAPASTPAVVAPAPAKAAPLPAHPPMPIAATPPPPPVANGPAARAAIVARPNRPKAAQAAVPNSGSRVNRSRLLGIGALVAVVVACVAAAAIYLPNPPFDGSKPKLVEPAGPGSTTPEQRPAKISDRIKRPDKTVDTVPDITSTPPQKPAVPAVPVADAKPALPVAQRAAIVVQVTADDAKNTNTYLGTVVWKTENASGGPSQVLQNVVRADITIPEAKMTAVILFQPNKDAAFPASHTLKVRFIPEAASPLGIVKAIDVPEMREENTPSGTRLLGLAATIADNNFLAALAQGEAIVPRNIELIRSRGWLDVPFKLASGQYGKMVVEKGAAGDRILNEALAAWGN